MPKSLEEIQAGFTTKKNDVKENKEELPIEPIKVKEKNKTKKVSFISDIIFVCALIMMGACAIILSYGEAGTQVDGIYRFVNEKREIVLITFAALVIFSFFLRFAAQKKEETIE